MTPTAAPDKMAGIRRDQVAGNLRQARDSRKSHEGALKRLRDTLPELLARGHEVGFTYDELAELAGISRGRVAQLLAVARGAE